MPLPLGESGSGQAVTRIRSLSYRKDPLIRSNSKTSLTVSAGMLKWSLSRSIKLGIFSRKVFVKEIQKTQSRKSTIDSKQRLLIAPGSDDAAKMAINNSRRSRSTADLYEESSSSEEESGEF